MSKPLWACLGLFFLPCAILAQPPTELPREESPAPDTDPPPAEIVDAPAMIRLQVPIGATVLVDGYRTRQVGMMRHFQTPPLPPGTYPMTLQVKFTRDGRPVRFQKEIMISGGSEISLDFREPPPDAEEWVEPKSAESESDEQASRRKDPSTIVVPYVPTPPQVVAEMLKLADVKANDVVYDLGCGDGRIVIAAVKQRGARKGVGIDLNDQRVRESRENAEKAGVSDKTTFKQGDVLRLKDISEASVVTLYLLPEVNRRLKPVLQASLKPGSRIVSHDFDMGPDWPAEKTTEVTDDDGIEHTLYLWRIPVEED